jgi:hypothetical protein
MVKAMLTTQMRKYSPAEPVNCMATRRGAGFGASGERTLGCAGGASPDNVRVGAAAALPRA